MSFESADDFLGDEFSEVATFGGQTASVLFDKSQFFQRSALTTRPIALGSSAALASLEEGSEIVIDSITYKVAEEPTSDGLMTTLVLRNA